MSDDDIVDNDPQPEDVWAVGVSTFRVEEVREGYVTFSHAKPKHETQRAKVTLSTWKTICKDAKLIKRYGPDPI